MGALRKRWILSTRAGVQGLVLLLVLSTTADSQTTHGVWQAVPTVDQLVLLRRLGDLALFRAGVFADSTGAAALTTAQAEHLGSSVGMTDDELDHLVDHGSSTPGLDALEQLSSAWYHAAAENSPSTPVLLRDVANRIRAARRFLNYIADHYLFRVERTWAIGA